MGNKGDRLSSASNLAAQDWVDAISTIGDITSKRMFGGNGIFHEGKMFGIVDSTGKCFLKVDDTNRADFEAEDSEKHNRMPYYAIPREVIADSSKLIKWSEKSIQIKK